MSSLYQNIFTNLIHESLHCTLDEAISYALEWRLGEGWQGTVKVEGGVVRQVITPDQADRMVDERFPERRREYENELAREQ